MLAAVLSLMALLVAATAVVPAATLMEVLAAWLLLPVAAMTRLPLLTAMLPRLRALLLVRAALAGALVMRATEPVRALPALARLMPPLAALKVAVPPTTTAVLV